MDSASSSSSSEGEGPAFTAQPKGQWTSEQKTCIRSFSLAWNKEGAERNVILAQIIEALQKLPEPPRIADLGVVCYVPSITSKYGLTSALFKHIKKYLSNSCCKSRDMKPGKKPSVWEVVRFLRSKELDEKAKIQVAEKKLEVYDGDDEGEKKSGNIYLGIHSKLVSEMMAGLTDSEKKEIEEIRDSWANKGPPPKARRKYIASSSQFKSIYQM